MRVRMLTQMTGRLNDQPWPPPGADVHVGGEVGQKLCASGVASTLAAEPGPHSSCADLAAEARRLIASGDLPAADALIRRTVHHYAHPVVDLFTEITRLEPL